MKNSTRPNNPELDATKVPTEIDIAWAAGIYEGEGCCRLCGHNKRSFMVAVAQKDPELLYRLRDWFGGSVADSGNASGCHNWNCCGDRSRIFIALIYKFMTARRKFQIDATNALDFLRGQNPANLNILQLKSALDEYYADHKEEVRERVKKSRAAKYKQLSSDPEWMKQTLVRNAEYRKNLTPEQVAEAQKYQREYYQNKKKIHQLPIGISA